MKKQKEMKEEDFVKRELSLLMETTLRLEDELNSITNYQ
jgi:hypothetical protein